MSLVTIQPFMARGAKEGFAVPLFDTFDGLTTDGIVAALEENHAPGIVAVYSGTFEQPNAKALIAYIHSCVENLSVPASLMLDHGTSLEQCIQAIRLGFTDVMFDGSSLPIEENMAQTRAIVRVAHAVGVHVEAELGHVGSGSNYTDYGGRRKGFTDPDDVERFVTETGVDYLAVAIGSAHGVYHGQPQLDLELLAEIRRRVDIPLVMHGGSGLSEAQFRGAVAGGISKINVATDLIVTAGKRIIVEGQAENASYFSQAQAARDAFKDRSAYYLDLFGAKGKA